MCRWQPHRIKPTEAQRRRAEAARQAAKEKERQREEQRKLEKVRQIGLCPAGFGWHKRGDMYYCGGGTHSVHESQIGSY